MIIAGINSKATQTKYTRPLYGLHGEYSLSKAAIVPYMSVNLPIEQAINLLKTYDQVPPSLDQKWSLEELYQREIDYQRIDHQIVNGYLRDSGKIKFFNSITVALFPRGPTGAVLNDFQSDLPTPPVVAKSDEWPLDVNFLNTEDTFFFGGVQYSRTSVLSRLRWDENQVSAIAIDGQHRLTALRRWYENKHQTLEIYEKSTAVPVLFLLLHDSVGFKAPSEIAKAGIRRVAREIFTDLNKNARSVDEAREIVLDDRSLPALCARQLVTRDTGADSDIELPLTLVRWQEANARFDQGYFINSLVNLHQLVEGTLQLETPSDPLDAAEVKKYIKTIDANLSASGCFTDGELSLEEYYKKNYLSAEDDAYRPFMHLPGSYLIAAVAAFNDLHKPYLIRMLRELRPYSDVLSYASTNHLVTGFFGQWFAQPMTHKQLLRPELEKEDLHWQESKIDLHISNIEKIKGRGDDESWAFKVIFQKALVQLFRLVCFQYPDDSSRLGTASELISYLNSLDAAGLLRVKAALDGEKYTFWTFVALHPTSQKIKVNRKVQDTLFHVLLLGYYVNRKHHVDATAGIVPMTDPSEMLRYFSVQKHKSGDEPPQLWPMCKDAVENLQSVLKQGLRNLVDDGEDPDKAARHRAVQLLRALAVSFSPIEAD